VVKKKKQKKLERIRTKDVIEEFEAAKGKDNEDKVRVVAKKLGVTEGAVKAKLKLWWGMEKYGKKFKSARGRFPATRDEVIKALNAAFQDGDHTKRNIKSAFVVLKKKYPNLKEQSFRNRIAVWIKKGEIKKTVKFV